MTVGIAMPRPGEDTKAWGRMLRERREAADLTRTQLARMSSVADSTIRNLETGRNRPSRSIVMRLQSVPALCSPQKPFAVPFEAAVRGVTESLECNCWFAPEYDSITLARQMVAQLNNPSGGSLDQTFLYMDSTSASDWCHFTEQSRWRMNRSQFPSDEVANLISGLVKDHPIDLFGLGPGEARLEVQLMKQLMEQGVLSSRLFLLDVSQPLLCQGYRHAASELAETQGTSIYAIQGNFHHLPLYKTLLRSTNRRRLVTLLGFTFGNLWNEMDFVEKALAPFTPGDLLLIDTATGTARVQPQTPSVAQPFFEGPFLRHVIGVKSTLLCYTSNGKSSSPLVADQVTIQIKLEMNDGSTRKFDVGVKKHYSPAAVAKRMMEAGWRTIAAQPFFDNNSQYFLFEKVEMR